MPGHSGSQLSPRGDALCGADGDAEAQRAQAVFQGQVAEEGRS